MTMKHTFEDKIKQVYEEMLTEQRQMTEQREPRFTNDDKNTYMSMILSPLFGKKFGKWKLEEDYGSGGIFWSSSEYPEYFIYMTPFWEGANGIPISMQDEYGNEVYNKIIRFKTTFDSKKDIAQYMNISKQHQAMLEKQLRSKSEREGRR